MPNKYVCVFDQCVEEVPKMHDRIDQ
jgi:hypothetical protein